LAEFEQLTWQFVFSCLEDQDKHAVDGAFLESQQVSLAAIEKNADKQGATKAAPVANPGSSDKAGPSGVNIHPSPHQR